LVGSLLDKMMHPGKPRDENDEKYFFQMK